MAVASALGSVLRPIGSFLQSALRGVYVTVARWVAFLVASARHSIDTCLYGAVVGTAVFLLAQNYLQDLLGLLVSNAEPGSLFAELAGPDRWLLWFGLLFVLSVYFFPAGIVGQLRLWAERRRERKADKTPAASPLKQES